MVFLFNLKESILCTNIISNIIQFQKNIQSHWGKFQCGVLYKIIGSGLDRVVKLDWLIVIIVSPHYAFCALWIPLWSWTLPFDGNIILWCLQKNKIPSFSASNEIITKFWKLIGTIIFPWKISYYYAPYQQISWKSG